MLVLFFIKKIAYVLTNMQPTFENFKNSSNRNKSRLCYLISIDSNLIRTQLVFGREIYKLENKL